jgi:hypothetical protein
MAEHPVDFARFKRPKEYRFVATPPKTTAEKNGGIC